MNDAPSLSDADLEAELLTLDATLEVLREAGRNRGA